MQTKTPLLLIGALIIVVIGGLYLFMSRSTELTTDTPDPSDTPSTPVVTPEPVATTTTDVTPAVRGESTVIGTSAGGEAITAYHFGTGTKEILLVGGIHGGYSWNTALLGHDIVDYLGDNPDVIPEGVMVTVIPAFNADGLMETVKTTGRFTTAAVPTSEAARIAGRFNANTVDLNRNFDCEWEAQGTWRSRNVSGGSAPFSEPEAAALRDYVADYPPTAVIGWYSAAGGVYASNCGDGVSAETRALMQTFATASGYTAHDEFNYYEITGDMMNWFAKQDIPAISILLTDHQSTEWEKNRRGLEAAMKAVAAQ